MSSKHLQTTTFISPFITADRYSSNDDIYTFKIYWLTYSTNLIMATSTHLWTTFEICWTETHILQEAVQTSTK